MDYLDKIVEEIETHSLSGIKECFENGVSPNDYFKDKALIYELISEYARGPQFSECVKIFIDYGLEFDDIILLAVLSNDADTLKEQLKMQPEAINNKYSFQTAFTPIFDATLLHVCAEYNHVSCAEVLVEYGADVNTRAGIDENGFGGHTPIFHTVNQNENKCIDMMNFLISKSADVTVNIKGLIWGKDYSWETFIPAVNPISYAMMGLLRQFQRREVDIYKIVSILMKAAYGIEYFPKNMPNRYLMS